MYLVTGFTGLDVFEKDLDHLKSEEEQHLSGNQVAEELKEELERLGGEGEETYIYRISKFEFHFSMSEESGGLTLSIHYTGYTES
jgi:hypothetical protein